MNSDEKIKKILDPIMDLFSGADGGSAFVRLRHVFLPDIFVSAEEGSSDAEDMIFTINRFSRLCKMMLNEKETE